MLLQAEELGRGRRARRRRGIVAQHRIVPQEIHRIDAQPVDAAPKPEARRFLQRIEHRRIAQIERRLRRQEVMQVVLPPPGVPFPGRTAKDGEPVVGWRAVGPGVGPHVPVGLFAGADRTALLEPGMRVGGVAPDLIDHHLDAERVRALHQPVEVLKRPERRIDLAMRGDVISEIVHGRTEERRDPHRVDAQRGDVVELLHDAGEIAFAVAVAVLEAQRIDLIDDGTAPPLTVLHGSFSTSRLSGFGSAT